MRLLHVTNLSLHEFFDKDAPSYAILSHRWGKEEVTFEDMKNGRGPSRLAWAKIQGLCRRAAADGFEYCWIDTCCIDKSSSAELSEAINSMYNWYLRSGTCYAYLADVNSGEDPHEGESSFRHSVWFTRGWTLQELLAPSFIYFFGGDWREIGSRRTLTPLIADITGIDVQYFTTGGLENFSVAQRMSWAARRTTTRPEDMAYCLLGIFNVNMPLLYGEGTKAFQRLQEAILSQTDDYSLFANGDTAPMVYPISFFAQGPADFSRSGHVRRTEHTVSGQRQGTGWSSGAVLTNRGVDIALPIIDATGFRGDDLETILSTSSSYAESSIAVLNCERHGQAIGILLWEKEPGVYERGIPGTKGTRPRINQPNFFEIPSNILKKAELQNVLLFQPAHSPMVRNDPFTVEFHYPHPSVWAFRPYWLSISGGELQQKICLTPKLPSAISIVVHSPELT